MANVDSEQDRYRVFEHPAWVMVNSGLTVTGIYTLIPDRNYLLTFRFGSN